MNYNTAPASVSISRIAKLIIRKLVPLSMVALIGANAYADNCRDLNALIGRYVSNGTYVENDLSDTTSDWTLDSQGLRYSDYQNAKFELSSIKVKMHATAEKPYSQKIDTISCEYKAPNIQNGAGRFYLNIKVGAKLTIDSYVIAIAYLKRQDLWARNEGPIKTDYSCPNPSTTTNPQCGGFSYTYKKQENGWWKDAIWWCTNWTTKARCKGSDGFDIGGYYGDFPKEMQARVNYRVPIVLCFGERSFNKRCRKINAKPFCEDLKCTKEIERMNNIVGGALESFMDPAVGGPNGDMGGMKQGMAKEIGMCWSYLDWKNREWDVKYQSNNTNCSNDAPTGTWPNYRQVGLE